MSETHTCQYWLHMRITWKASKSYKCLAPFPPTPNLRFWFSLGETLGILIFKKWAPQVILMCSQGGESLPENTEWKKQEDLQKTRRISGRACVSRIMLVFYFLTPSCQEREFSFQAANHDIASPGSSRVDIVVSETRQLKFLTTDW